MVNIFCIDCKYYCGLNYSCNKLKCIDAEITPIKIILSDVYYNPYYDNKKNNCKKYKKKGIKKNWVNKLWDLIMTRK